MQQVMHEEPPTTPAWHAIYEYKTHGDLLVYYRRIALLFYITFVCDNFVESRSVAAADRKSHAAL